MVLNSLVCAVDIATIQDKAKQRRSIVMPQHILARQGFADSDPHWPGCRRISRRNMCRGFALCLVVEMSCFVPKSKAPDWPESETYLVSLGALMAASYVENAGQLGSAGLRSVSAFRKLVPEASTSAIHRNGCRHGPRAILAS